MSYVKYTEFVLVREKSIYAAFLHNNITNIYIFHFSKIKLKKKNY